MSENEPETKDVFDLSRTPGHGQFECENLSIIQAMQEVTNQADNTSTAGKAGHPRNTLGADCKHQSLDNVIKLTKERCEALQTISDRAAVSHDKAETEELLTLVNTYRSCLARLLQGKCAYYLLRGEYMEVYYYARELENVATKLSSSVFLNDAKRLLSKKFVTSNLNLSCPRQKCHLLKAHATILHENIMLIQKSTRNELLMEYRLLFRLHSVYSQRCNFQFSLDLCNRLLEIACDVQKRELIIEILAEFAHLYLLLGKYQLSYDIMKGMQNLKTDDIELNYVLVCNFSVVELLLGLNFESLQHAWDSLDLALGTKDPGHIACAYGNIGLALEYMGMYDDAIEPYENCLRIGEEADNYRVINNGLCNLGRAYRGLGDNLKAKEYFKKAVETPRPPKAYWCDTEEFRFSGDYLLAKLAVEEKNWDEATKHLTEAIKRCETLRKSIQNSPIKISFNDTQRKPYQYLQHVMLEEGNEIEALVVAEKGRGRDFFDKFENEFCMQLDSREVLMDMIKSRNIAVLFISTLEDVGKLCLWFISSDGKLQKQWSIPNTECNKMLTALGDGLHKTQGRHEIEFRGTKEERYSLIGNAFELIKRDFSANIDTGSTNTCQPCTDSSLIDTKEENTTNARESSVNTSSLDYSLSDLIDQLSELILTPFQKQLEHVVNEPTTELLIIPQGKAFNIPFSSLRLNGKPLCNYVTNIEAFSFNSFFYFTAKRDEKTETGNFENALIVGNPTHASNLPRAEEEAKGIAKLLGVTPLIGKYATREEVVERLPSARLIHFACHGETGGKGLVLACDNSHPRYKDCHLTSQDVENMELNADLVVLSACYTARGDINSEGVLSLARAFQIAGAGSVVTALWAIPDNATKYFMQHFYGNLRGGLAIADAIRSTQVTMQQSPNFKEVINWGSFKVLGANAKIM